MIRLLIAVDIPGDFKQFRTMLEASEKSKDGVWFSEDGLLQLSKDHLEETPDKSAVLVKLVSWAEVKEPVG